jgi:hypothetical protein
MARDLLQNPQLYNATFYTANKTDVLKSAITDNYQLTNNHPGFMWLDPNGASKDVLLPLATDETSKGLRFLIFNDADAAGEMLVVKNSAETETVATIAPGDIGMFWNDGTAATSWTGMIFQASLNGAGLITLAATALTLTKEQHNGKTIVLNHTGAASTVTLPAATGTGAGLTFIVGAVNTSNHLIKVPDASHTLKGSLNILDSDATAQTAYPLAGTDDTITLNGTTTGGQIGDWIEMVDIAANVWAVRGQLVVPAGSNIADPTSATV